MHSSVLQSDRLPPALEASGFVGIWTWDIEADLVVLDGLAAELLAGSADLAGCPLTLDAATKCLHPEDRDRIQADFLRQARRCGPILIEYRVLSPSGQVRWVLDRGRIDKDPDGSLQGRGVLIDITDTREPAPSETTDGVPLELMEAVEQCLRARGGIIASGSDSSRLLMDLLLLDLGRSIARKLEGPDSLADQDR